MSYSLYYWPTPNAHKITMFFEEASIPYEITAIDITKGAQFSPDFLQISPNNRIPALTATKDGDQTICLFESGAILMFLAETHKLFLPEFGPERFRTMQWLFWQVGGLGPMAGQNHHFQTYAPSKIPYAIDRYVIETQRLYRVLDRQLQSHPFVAGDQLSIADFAVYPWIVPWQRQGQNLSETPHLKNWFERIQERPATQRAYQVADRWPTASELDQQAQEILFPGIVKFSDPHQS